MDCCQNNTDNVDHRFLGYYQRWILGRSHAIYRCVCGYTEASPLDGGPGVPLNPRFEPIRDARRMATHLDLERAHQLN